MVNVNGKALNREEFKEFMTEAILTAKRRKRIKENHKKRIAAKNK